MAFLNFRFRSRILRVLGQGYNSPRILAHLYGQRRNNCKGFHSSTAHIYDVPITTLGYYFGGLKEMQYETIETLTIISRSSTIMPGILV